MLFGSKHQTLEDRLVAALLDGEKTAKELYAHPSIAALQISLQAVYKVLKQLVAAEVVLKHRTRFAVSTEWMEQVQSVTAKATPLTLAVGDTLTYTFSTFAQTDVYWKHIAYMVPEEIQTAAFLSYLPHNYWLSVPDRQESEARYYAHFAATRRNGFMVIGGNTEGDNAVAKQIRNDFLRVNTIAYPKQKRTDHIVVMADYIINTRVDQATTQLIDSLYDQYKGEELQAKLQKVFAEPTKITINLSRNPQKAKQLAKIITRDFHVPPVIRAELQSLGS